MASGKGTIVETRVDENEISREEDGRESVFVGGQETIVVAEEGKRLAPAKRYCPISILLEEDAEYLAFPKIFGGRKLKPVAGNRPLSCEIASNAT
jgi:hypothetical protein